MPVLYMRVPGEKIKVIECENILDGVRKEFGDRYEVYQVTDYHFHAFWKSNLHNPVPVYVEFPKEPTVYFTFGDDDDEKR